MNLLDARQLNALWTLGWALAKHVVARPFVGRRNPARWLETLRGESLAAVPPAGWDLFEKSSRCIGCALCDAVGEPGDAPSEWIVGIARRPEDAPLAMAKLERLEALAPAIERICPARMPVTALVELTRENARLLDSP